MLKKMKRGKTLCVSNRYVDLKPNLFLLVVVLAKGRKRKEINK